MIEIAGYTGLSLNLISMAMRNTLYLRVCALIANAVYIVYGFLLNAPPIYIGCSIAVLLHSYRIFKMQKETSKNNS